MAKEELILIEEDATNALGFRLDDIQEIVYEERSSGVGTVQLLVLKLPDQIITLSGAEATSVYTTIKDSFSAGGAGASPDPTEATQASIRAAMDTIAGLRNALSSVAGGVFMRVGTDGVPLDVTITGLDHDQLDGLADDDHLQYLLAAGTRPLTGDWDAGGFEIRAQTLEADVGIGTAPLTITSTTMVANLNADLLDGSHASAFASAAIDDEQYVVLAATADLANERVLTGTGNQIILADGGAGGNIVLSTPQDIDAAAAVQFGTIGVGAALTDGMIHVQSAGAGAVAAHINADELVLEGAGLTGLSILTPLNQTGSIFFGSPTDNARGFIQYDHNLDKMKFGVAAGAEAVFNDDGIDADFRVESNNNVNMLFVDGGNDRVGIGTAWPDGPLHVHAASAGVVSAQANSVLVLENSSNVLLQMLCPDARVPQIHFGVTSDVDFMSIRGHYNAGSPYLRFMSGGTELVRIKSDRYVGMGTSTPDGSLHVHAASAGVVSAQANSVLVLENSSNVLLQMLCPDAKVPQIHFGVVSNNSIASVRSRYSAGAPTLEFYVNGNNKRMQIENDGGIFMYSLLAAAASTDVNINGSNELHSVTSSKRFKKFVQPLDKRFDSSLIYDLKPRSFIWKKSTGNPNMLDYGLVAEEAYEVMPEIVNLDAEDRPYSIRSGSLPVMMLAEMQKLEKRVSLLEAA